ncbi:mitochondrial tRNA-specific 2-thiouridylase 1 [Anthonomus grandis grandis]|uniref:mitochondrial tRNA-specific 2-thiouridylase 1 n=1 Tax=Anthonomus grandis grandis TaxID=2921223 RepID=UPI00216658A7|nr:mitochondrial tRNA-specific 2-thiouridylase 1 [Anthonomus grandis grandis]
MIRRVALGISGGVDSAVAALLLKNKGYDVQGVFMKNWDIADEKGSCRADEDYKDASYICNQLNIKLHHVNFVKEYWNEVFCNLIKEYESGMTPNPDILCNRNVKFNYFYKYAMEHLKADAIATGHYARTSFGPYLENFNPNESVRLLRAEDARKDQTFFLCQVRQEALRRTMFPLGDLIKFEVKQLAAQNNLEKIALKHESMGICFIGSRNFQEFIQEYIEDKPGKFVDIDTGEVVGEHKGLHQWTLGQRSRLHSLPDAYFICRKSLQDSIIYVAQGTNHPALYSSLFFTLPPHWIHSQPKELQRGELLQCEFKFQHTQTWAPCRILQSDEGLVVRLEYPKRALTPGQYAVFYKDKECLGSSRILNAGVSDFMLNYNVKRAEISSIKEESVNKVVSNC